VVGNLTEGLNHYYITTAKDERVFAMGGGLPEEGV